MPEERRRRLHLEIGRFLEASCGDGAEGALFDAADQLNLGAALLDAAQRDSFARLNHRAGVKARRAAAFGPALAYFRSGLGLLPEGAPRSRYELWFSLHRDAAECAALTDQHAMARALVEKGLRHAASIPERVDLEALRIMSATITGEHDLALGWGRDALSLLKAAETLSGEIVLDRLLEKLLAVCLEAAGAQRGALVLEEEGELFVRAVGSVAAPVSLERTPLSRSREVPRRVVEQAYSAREILVLDDAASAPERDRDHHLAEGASRSVLVLPIQRKETRLGVVYLENNLTTCAFTRARVHVLELLSDQIAIALENARLYREAQHAVRVRDEFLSVASHELRTPVTSLRLDMQALLRRDRHTSEERLGRALQRMDRQVHRLVRLIEELLDVSQLDTGRLALHLEPVDLAKVVDDVAQKDGTAQLVVQDQGIGIPPGRLPHVFERFERAVSSRHFGGLGLGLHVVKSIVEALGGAVRGDSRLGEGSRFTVELPCEPLAASRTAPATLGGARP
ncbi:GAF domain-containing sensor histidine kinase [Sorangium sp. So ce388]|uniref:sensor histidine kinase n=1 Tax=Sorangium sp. So ce388 TaxID=3133309 RepID=UPI003F5C4AD5